jgi:hypothetical protein
MSIVDGFDLYHKLLEISKKVEHTPSKEFRIGFMTSSLINFNALAELYPSVIAEEEECYVPKHVPKDIFIKHIFVVISYSTCLT